MLENILINGSTTKGIGLGIGAKGASRVKQPNYLDNNEQTKLDLTSYHESLPPPHPKVQLEDVDVQL